MATNNSNAFKATYKCGPLNTLRAFRSKAIEETGRIIVPYPVAEVLASFGTVTYPLCFKMTNANTNMATYCALYDYGYNYNDVTYMPTSVMNKLKLNDWDNVIVEYIKLPKATALFLETEVLHIFFNEDLKLEVLKKLWELTCLNEGDMITGNFLGTNSMTICEILPCEPAYVVKPEVFQIFFVPKSE